MILRLRSLCFGLIRGEAVLPGLWRRVGDEFEGCLTLVESTQAGLEGRITYVPPAMRRFGWTAGDIKWRRIAPAGAAAFRVDDLVKTMDPHKKHVLKLSYSAAKLLFLREHEIALVAKDSNLRSSRWMRLQKGPMTQPSGKRRHDSI